MTADYVFSIANLAAMAGWLVLAAGAITRRGTLVTLSGVFWPLGFSAAYAMLILFFFAQAPGGFDSLAHVQQLFTYHWAALAGWVHYLAFDLFIGGWITSETLRLGLPRLALIILLPLTFMFGPMGLLLFFVVKLALQKKEALA
jgi:hypothetical protein